ncbi:MAG TPA: FAD-dependent oxidoreductase [Actinophytocola sp.]|nr:FAD-dependent oxidoreductase [Actinophytocola sp.]
MTYVVTQSCCADASCVVACPVNCIHPAPGEPGFAEAEMLYVDANSCVDCGACLTACPVDAIRPHTELTPDQQPFVALNAAYYDAFPHPDRTPLALVPRQRRLTRRGPFRFAVVGSGPAGMYVADELLRHPEITVDVIDRLPTPYGLVRAGVAPDHQATKQVSALFEAIERAPGFDYLLGVDVGRDVTHDELARHYDGVVYAVGAANDRRLGIPGEDLPGSVSATDLVGWYNGHPDKQELRVPLQHERVVVVGNGNVALDVARILTADPDDLATTDIAALPWATLSRSRVCEVVVLGRRGPAEAAFTVPELVGLAGIEDLNVVVDTGGETLAGDTAKLRLLAELAARPRFEGRRTLVLRFRTTPGRVLGTDRVTGVEVLRDGATETIACGLVLRAIGYHGEPIPDLPHDPRTGTVPHDRGRVRPGVYVAGWAKRGPTGFIGTNKSCAQETVERMLDDVDSGVLPVPTRSSDDLAATLELRGVVPIDAAGWRAIDHEERRRGMQRGRPRLKLVDPAELRRVARERTARPGYSSARRRRQKRG